MGGAGQCEVVTVAWLQATLWEGGTRAAALLHGPMLARPGTISRALVHVTDWLPTLVRAAGGDPATLPRLDGVDQWAGLVRGAGRGPRREMLYNIDPLRDGDSGPNAAIR